MNVLNRDWAYVAVLIGGQRFIWKKVNRDQTLIDMITERLVEFWEVNVLKGIEPAIDGSDATTDFLKERYSEEGENEITLSSTFDELIETKKQLKDDEAFIKKKIQQIDNQITSELGKQNAVVAITPKSIISWKSFNRKTINKDLLEKKYPEVANDHSIYKTSCYKKLAVKEIN